MSCPICLESYMDVSKLPDPERFPYLSLEKENLPPTSQGCCFSRPKKYGKEFHSSEQHLSESDSQPMTSKCGHVFHLICIKNWSDSSGENGKRGCPQCPVCRETIVLKKLIKLHLDTHVVIRQETSAGLLVSMSLNQFNRMKEGFTLGYHSGQEQFEDEFQARINNEKVLKEQAQNAVLQLKSEHTAQVEKLKAENAAAINKVKGELMAKQNSKPNTWVKWKK